MAIPVRDRYMEANWSAPAIGYSFHHSGRC